MHLFDSLCLATLHFDGTIEPRVLRGKGKFKGRLHFAHAGDVIYSKIDVRNGAIGIVPSELPAVAVSSEYPVYEVLPDAALAEYVKLVFRTPYFRRIINSMISGASGRKRVQPAQLESVEIPLPPPDTQRAIVVRWQAVQAEIAAAGKLLSKVVNDLNELLLKQQSRDRGRDILGGHWMVLSWRDVSRWDVKTARAAIFRARNPSFRPLSAFAEEAVDLVKPWEQPENDWPVYGVNNREGVFFSHHQKGREFRPGYLYKRIQKDWFFHNPTRSSVGSLGIVPEVPKDAITSSEYQVWRIKQGMIPGYVAVLISTPFFIDLIQIHRVGAVKQRLYAANLMEIHVPVISTAEQQRIAEARKVALDQIAQATRRAEEAKTEIEALILGTRKL